RRNRVVLAANPATGSPVVPPPDRNRTFNGFTSQVSGPTQASRYAGTDPQDETDVPAWESKPEPDAVIGEWVPKYPFFTYEPEPLFPDPKMPGGDKLRRYDKDSLPRFMDSDVNNNGIPDRFDPTLSEDRLPKGKNPIEDMARPRYKQGNQIWTWRSRT